jgi:hypothetical protein
MSDITHNGLYAALTQLLTLAVESKTFAEFEEKADALASKADNMAIETVVINATCKPVKLDELILPDAEAREIVEQSLQLNVTSSRTLLGRTVPVVEMNLVVELPVVKGRLYIVPETYIHLAKRNGRTSDDLYCYIDEILCQIF